MRVALVHPFAWPDVRRGGERYLDDLAWYLRGEGHAVDVIAGTKTSTRASETAQGSDVRLRHLPNVVVWRLKVRLREPETFGARAFPFLARHRYDIVHALVPGAAIAACLARRRVVFTLLGHPTDQLLAESAPKRIVLRRAIAAAHAVTALSSTVARDVGRSLGRTPDVIAPGVRTDRFGPAARTETPTILFASAMRPDKGLDVLLRAFARVAAAHATVRLVLSGPGDPAWAFDAAATELAAFRERVDVLGPGKPEDLPNHYATAHVTALPSRNEAFGLVLAESLASGTPVVGCAGGGADDIVTDEVGRIVAHGDPVALARALEECLDMAKDPDVVRRCVNRAQLWDWKQTIGPLHEAVYRRVLNGASPS